MEITIKSAHLTAEMVKSKYKEGHVNSKDIKLEKFDDVEKWVIPVTFNIGGTAEEIEYIPNKTMLRELLEAWGSESNDWDGQKIKFSTTKLMFQGKMVDSIVAEPEVAKKI